MAKKEKTRALHLRRRQLDEIFSFLPPASITKPPPHGWIAEIRQVLGMSRADLAGRLGMSHQGLERIEANETKRTITLQTLEKVASALGCRITYGLVPEDPLEKILHVQARKVATKMMARLSHTMALEDQKVSKKERESQIEEITSELVQTLSKELWGDH